MNTTQHITTGLETSTINWTEIASSRLNRRALATGGTVVDLGTFATDTLQVDAACSADDGWETYETDQDSWFFGVWVNRTARLVVTVCEGDISIVTCPDTVSFQRELASMDEFYGN